MELVLLLLALGLTAGASASEDSRFCPPHTRPWQVSLHGPGTRCSAALVNQWWLVTSAACASTSSGVTASLGEHDVTAEEGTEQHVAVAEVVRHSPYRSPLHSLAMVRLAQPARLDRSVQPIGLPGRCPRAGDSCGVSGWGSTVPNQYESPKEMKCLSVPIAEDQTCMKSLPDYLFWSPWMLCAGAEHTANCLNDKGAVLVCDGQLQGVQWFSLGCQNQDHPGVFTKLCEYTRWMRDVMDSRTPTTTTARAPTTKKP